MAEEDQNAAEQEEQFASIDELGSENVEEEVSNPEETEEEKQERLLANKFKSTEELEKAYQELEKEKSRLGNEVGNLRKEVDQYIVPQLQNQGQQQTQEDSEEEVDFWENPEKAIEKKVNESIEPVKQEISQRQAQEAQQRFFQQHPDAAEVYQSQEFQDWLEKNPATKNVLVQADQNYDADSASEILSLYKQSVGKTTNSNEPSHDSEAVKEATVEGSQSQKSDNKKYYRRTDILRLQRENPQRYKELWPDILKAYEEGRVK